MARRRRVDGSGDQPCRCHQCLKQDPEGVLAPQSVLIAHRHRERLRAAFASATQTAETEAAPESFTTSRGGTDSHLENQPSESSCPASNSSSETHGCNNTETAADFKAWLRSVVTEIDVRIEALYDCDLGLEFITPPSQTINSRIPKVYYWRILDSLLSIPEESPIVVYWMRKLDFVTYSEQFRPCLPESILLVL